MTRAAAEGACHQATGFAPGKVLVVGEHAVVHGQPAFALPFPAVSVKVTATPRVGALRLVSGAWTGDLAPGAAMPEAVGCLAAAAFAGFAALGREPVGLELSIASTIPFGAGLGSSAAVASALVSALLEAFDAHFDLASRLALVHAGECVAHTSPSGVDAYVVCAGVPTLFHRGVAVEPVSTGGTFHLVVADSGVSRNTAKAVQAVQHLRESAPGRVQAALVGLGECARAASTAWAHGNVQALGVAMNEAQELLHDLGVSTPALARLIAAARAAGALGAKLTGAGMGGCVLALAPDTLTAARIEGALGDAGARAVWRQTYATEGA